MALNSQRYRASLTRLGDEQPVFVEPSAAFRTWLVAKRLPEDVVEFVSENAIAENLAFRTGSGGMWPPQDIVDLNEQESSFLAGGFLAVGNTITGDFIVIDLRDPGRRAGFVGHDELAGNYAEAQHLKDDPRAIFVPVADSLDELLAGVSAALGEGFASDPPGQHSFPIDYCDAKSWDEGRGWRIQRDSE
jgi:hypothetical protein